MHKGWYGFDINWLVLITGTVKTLKWASATFKGAGKHHFNVWPDQGINAQVSSPSPLEGHAQWGPGAGHWTYRVIRETDPELAARLPGRDIDLDAHTHCLFVHYLTLSTKWPILTLKAASAPRTLSPPDDEDDDTVPSTSDNSAVISEQVRPVSVARCQGCLLYAEL